MSSAITLWIDIAVLSTILGSAAVQLPSIIAETQDPIIQMTEDKTAKDTYGSTIPAMRAETGSDIIMMLVNADDNIPYPRSIKINDTPIIDLNSAFFAQQQSNVHAILADSGTWKLGNMQDYKVTSVEFVQDNAEGDYWHYTLVP